MRTRLLLAGSLLGALLIGAGLAWLLRPSPPPGGPSPQQLARLQQPRVTPAQLRVWGIPREPADGAAQDHRHVAVRLWINGQLIQPPRGIGVVDGGPLAAIHTHDQTGVVHLHAVGHQRFRLKQILRLWGVGYPQGELGGWSPAAWQQGLWINGVRQPWGRDPVLADRADVVLAWAGAGVQLGRRPPLPHFAWGQVPLQQLREH